MRTPTRPRPLRRWLLAVAVLVLGAGAATALAADGEVDSSFGIKIVPVAGTSGSGSSSVPLLAPAPDGGVVMASRLPGDTVSVVKLRSDGSPDPAFNGGEAAEWSPSTESAEPLAVRALADGRVAVVAGRVPSNLSGDPTPEIVALVFSASGVVATPEAVRAADFTCGTFAPTSASFASDNRVELLFACGSGRWQRTSVDLGMDKVAGVVDASGSADGIQQIVAGAGGRIWVIHDHESYERFKVRRFAASGVEEGVRSYDVSAATNERAASAAPDGGIAIPLNLDRFDPPEWRVLRLAADGSPVAGFGVDGVAKAIVTQASFQPSASAVTSDGRVLLAGDGSNDRSAVVVRLTPTGQLDPTWDSDGIAVITPTLGFDDRVFGVGLGITPSNASYVGLVFGDDPEGEVPSRTAAVRSHTADHGMRFGIARLQGTPPAAPPATTTGDPSPPAAAPPPVSTTTPSLSPPAQTTTTTKRETKPKKKKPKPKPKPRPKPKPAKKQRKCLSRRDFRIRVSRVRGGAYLIGATVRVNGERVRVRRRYGRFVANVDLRRFKPGTFTVRIKAWDVYRRKHSETRRYRTCRVGKGGRPVRGGSIVFRAG